VKWQAIVVLTLLSVVAITANAQSSTEPSNPRVAPQVRPALPPRELVGSKEQEFISREKARLQSPEALAKAQDEARLKRETLALGYWVDPSTGLMWAAKDNGKAVTWRGASRYCRKLRVEGYSDWRLASIFELEGIYDKSAEALGRDRRGASTWHVKGNLFLTYSMQWSSSPANDYSGHPTAHFWYFDFLGRRTEKGFDDLAEGDLMHALCVRRPGE